MKRYKLTVGGRGYHITRGAQIRDIIRAVMIKSYKGFYEHIGTDLKHGIFDFRLLNEEPLTEIRRRIRSRPNLQKLTYEIEEVEDGQQLEG